MKYQITNNSNLNAIMAKVFGYIFLVNGFVYLFFVHEYTQTLFYLLLSGLCFYGAYENGKINKIEIDLNHIIHFQNDQPVQRAKWNDVSKILFRHVPDLDYSSHKYISILNANNKLLLNISTENFSGAQLNEIFEQLYRFKTDDTVIEDNMIYLGI